MYYNTIRRGLPFFLLCLHIADYLVVWCRIPSKRAEVREELNTDTREEREGGIQ